MLGKIYGLYNQNDTLLYVGQTKNTLNRRLSGHRRNPRGLMYLYGKSNPTDVLKIDLIEEIPVERLNDREQYWVNELKPPFNIALSDKYKSWCRNK